MIDRGTYAWPDSNTQPWKLVYNPEVLFYPRRIIGRETLTQRHTSVSLAVKRKERSVFPDIQYLLCLALIFKVSP